MTAREPTAQEIAAAISTFRHITGTVCLKEYEAMREVLRAAARSRFAQAEAPPVHGDEVSIRATYIANTRERAPPLSDRAWVQIEGNDYLSDCPIAAIEKRGAPQDEWRPIETAPKDGTQIKVKRVYLGRIVYEGPAEWRTVHFGELRDPISGEKFAVATDATGWMYPESIADKRVPEPTHWQPLLPTTRRACGEGGRGMTDLFALHEKMTSHLFPSYSSKDERFLALALCGEAGELANYIKKRWRDGSDFSEEIRDEIADIRVYLELLAKCFDIEGEKLDRRVQAKLAKFVEKHKARLEKP